MLGIHGDHPLLGELAGRLALDPSERYRAAAHAPTQKAEPYSPEYRHLRAGQSQQGWQGARNRPFRCKRLWGPTRGLDIVATLDDRGDTDLGGAVSIVSEVLTIGQEGIEFLGDSGSRGSPSVITAMDDALGVLVDDDESAVVGEGHG